MQNIAGRNRTSLNGKWQISINTFDVRTEGITRTVQPAGKTDFAEWGFSPALTLDVPGDWNSQLPELKYYEGTVWYRKTFSWNKSDDKRIFLHFGAVTYEMKNPLRINDALQSVFLCVELRNNFRL